MFDSIWQDIRREFSYGNMVTRLIIANVAVFVAFAILYLVAFLLQLGEVAHFFEDWLGFSSHWRKVIWKPWTPLTSMFLHLGFWHLLWNMLALYWFGRIVGDLIGDSRILPLYLIGGLGGGLLYFVGVNIYAGDFGMEHIAFGASAAVAAIMVTAGFLAPDYLMHLLFLGAVKLKYIVGAVLLLFILDLAARRNMGGQFAHIGGAITGWLFFNQLRNGSDWSIPVNRLINRIQGLFSTKKIGKNTRVAWKNPKPQPRRETTKTAQKPPSSGLDQSRIDAILDKIKEHGYENLTAEEKDDLFNASKKQK